MRISQLIAEVLRGTLTKALAGLACLLIFFLLPSGVLAALDEANGSNRYILTPDVSVGSYYDIVLQLRNKGSSPVNLTNYSTTGPFSIQ